MDHSPFPSSGFGTPSYAHLSLAQRAVAWADLVDAGLETVLASMRKRTNSEEELRAVFQQWLEKRRAEHDQAMLNMMRVLRDHGAEDGN